MPCLRAWRLALIFITGSLVTVGSTFPALAESSLGLAAGGTLAGDQDITLVNRNGTATPRDASVGFGPVGGVTGTFWWQHLGLQLDGLYWHTSAQTALPGSVKRVRINEDRPFAYGGVGAGGVVQGVNPGQITLERTVGAVAGGGIPITSHLRVRAEVRYIVTHDVDPKPGRGTATEVSGHRGNIPVGRSSAHTWTRNSSRFSSA